MAFVFSDFLLKLRKNLCPVLAVTEDVAFFCTEGYLNFV